MSPSSAPRGSQPPMVSPSMELDLHERLLFHALQAEGVHEVQGGLVVQVHVAGGDPPTTEDLLREGRGEGPRVPAVAVLVEDVKEAHHDDPIRDDVAPVPRDEAVPLEDA